MFAPRKGQWQFNLVLGNTGYVNDYNGLYWLLPTGNDNVGISREEGATISDDLSTVALNLGSFNYNSLTNIAGIEAKYFLTNHIDINLYGSYQLNMQPSKNYEENTTNEQYRLLFGEYDGEEAIQDLMMPSQMAIQGAVTNKLHVKIGSNYNFNVINPRIQAYLGIFGGFQQARIEAFYPYTGVSSYDGEDERELYRASKRAGQILAFEGGLVSGISYSVLPGFQIGFEVSPAKYQYSLMHLQVDGLDPYYANNHSLKVFAYPQVKFGFRF